MLDEHRLRDRFEILLDTRQVFLLFIACALILSLVFALGVVVGKRLATASAVADDPKTDPLALLDQIGRDEATEGKADEKLTYSDTLVHGREPATEPEASAPSKAPPPAVAAAAPAPPPPPTTGKDPAPAPTPPSAALANKPGGAYTLQLSSFQDKLEAEQFVEQLKRSGLRPEVIPTNIPDRGLWYRVRVGSFASWDAAVAAKAEFERVHKLVAYVSRR